MRPAVYLQLALKLDSPETRKWLFYWVFVKLDLR
jgi:hypothetical protein